MEYDVVVAGGGPAGLAAARAAAGAGARTLLVEREASFGIPTRTSGGSFISSLRALGIPSTLWTPIRQVRFQAPDAEAVLDYDEPVVCVLEVRELYQWLAERAAEAGAELQLRTTVLGAEMGDGVGDARGGVVLRLRGPGGEQSIGASVAVDATGTGAVLAAAVSLHPPFTRRGVGAEWDLAAPAHPGDTVVLAMGTQLAPSGYAWSFPHLGGRVRLGVGVMRPDSALDPRRLLPRALELPWLAERLRGAQPIEVHAGIIPAEPLRSPIVSGRIVLAGDAASHASTLVGEGIRYALRAGAGAGEAAALAARHGSQAPLLEHQRRHQREHRRDFAIAWRLNRRLSGFDDVHWNRAVELLARTPPWFAARALATDFRPAGIGRLGLTHPALALSLLRAAR